MAQFAASVLRSLIESVPTHVYNLSQDVEKCTLYLVLSHCTRTNALQGIALASKECPKFLQDPLHEAYV